MSELKSNWLVWHFTKQINLFKNPLLISCYKNILRIGIDCINIEKEMTEYQVAFIINIFM